MIDCVVSYHQNPYLCGVARFNHRLARELGVPLVPLLGLEHTKYRHPLISINWSEVSAVDQRAVQWPNTGRYSLFLHRVSGVPLSVIQRAARVFAGNQRVVRAVNAEAGMGVIPAWCPSLMVAESYEFESVRVCVLVCGMAHKVNVNHMAKIRHLLESQGSYRVEVSAGAHDGKDWADAAQVLVQDFAALFGLRFRFLGFAGDAVIAERLAVVDAVLVLVEPGVRANNTTLWTAMEAGCPVITLLDADSPCELVHGATVFDLHKLTAWPSLTERDLVGRAGQQVSRLYSWENLVTIVRARTT